MKIVFMGTPAFAVNSLDILVKEKHDILAVVTQPDKPKGRGKKVIYSEVKEYAVEHNIKVLQPVRMRDPEFVEFLKEMAPDIYVTAAYGRILTKEILDIPKYGCINVHASILPKYRGSCPIHWAIINGEKVSGITTMMTDIGMDTGDILLKEEVEIDELDTVGTLHDKLAVVGANVLKKTIDALIEGNLKRIPQNNEEATYVPMIKKDLGRIDWHKSAREIFNLIRGTNPWPGAYTFYLGERMRVWQSEVVLDNVDNSANLTVSSDYKTCFVDDDLAKLQCTTVVPGTILKVLKDGIYVMTGDRVIKIKEVQFDSCRKMCVEQYICGHSVNEGEIFE